jgi:hypothetical protein
MLLLLLLVMLYFVDAAVVNVVFIVDVAVVIVASVVADVDVNCNLQTSILIILSFSSVQGYCAALSYCSVSIAAVAT